MTAAKKITKLTPAQVSRFGEWSKKWIEIGLSTEPADFERATKAALRGYALANLKSPMVILRMSSPYAATVGGALAWLMLKEFFGKKVEQQVRQQVWQQVEQQLGQQVGQQVGQQKFRAANDGVNNYGINSLWCSWSAYISFFRDVCGWRDQVLEKFEINEELTQSCGWTWWHKNVLAISDRPLKISRDDQGRLHGEMGPSMLYRDGWALYNWHGVSVPSEWIEHKDKLTPKAALTWRNIEQRRAACEIVGWERILCELKGKSIDKDVDPQIGELIEVELPDGGPQRFLRVLCSTGRRFAIPVPREMKTALEANSATYGIPSTLFKPEVRT